MKATPRTIAFLFVLHLLISRTAAQTPGSVDPTFDAETGPAEVFWGLAVQPDGKILLAGRRQMDASTYYGSILRLETNGAKDSGFGSGGRATNPGAAIPQINCIGLEHDGRLVLGGQFTLFDDFSRPRLARLDSNGTLTSDFTPAPRDTIYALLIQPDGKILIGGAFTNFAGTGQNYLARLNHDGSVDPSFALTRSPGATVRALALQSDGRILAGGDFTNVAELSLVRIARFETNGAVDPTFIPGLGANGTVYAIATQPDGKLLVGGNFLEFDGTSRSRLARLNMDGTLDQPFPNPGCDSYVYALLVQTDGKILAGGRFNNVAGRKKIVRFNSNGTVDSSFDATAGSGTASSDEVRAVQLQADGKIIVAGKFTTFGGFSRYGVARLFNDALPPILTGQVSNNYFSFHYSCAKTSVVEVSPDLVSWQPVATNPPGTDITYIEPVQPGPRYFRVAAP